MPGIFLKLSMSNCAILACSIATREGKADWIVCSIESSSSIMQTYFANQSCDPFTAQSKPCTLGNYVNYAVNVSSSNDVIAAVNFARKNNIRFVIRNTGHE
jgi:hypothetical protein